jgi:hypothetical protein
MGQAAHVAVEPQQCWALQDYAQLSRYGSFFHGFQALPRVLGGPLDKDDAVPRVRKADGGKCDGGPVGTLYNRR